MVKSNVSSFLLTKSSLLRESIARALPQALAAVPALDQVGLRDVRLVAGLGRLVLEQVHRDPRHRLAVAVPRRRPCARERADRPGVVGQLGLGRLVEGQVAVRKAGAAAASGAAAGAAAVAAAAGRAVVFLRVRMAG